MSQDTNEATIKTPVKATEKATVNSTLKLRKIRIPKTIKIPTLKFSLSNINIGSANSITKLLLQVLSWFEIIMLLGLPIYTFTTNIPSEQIGRWLTLAIVILMLRLVRLLFVGMKALPGVSYDLLLLTSITVLLLSTILQGDSQSYANLGGGNIWGIGMILLAAITMYFINSNRTLIGTKRRYVFYSLVGLLLYVMLGMILSGQFSTITSPKMLNRNHYEIFMLAVISICLGISGFKYFKQPVVKSIIALTLVSALPVLLVSLNWIFVLMFSVATTLASLFALYTNTKIFTTFKNDLESFKNAQLQINSLIYKNHIVFGLVGSITLFLIALVGISTNSTSQLILTQIGQSYAQLPRNFSTLGEVFLGTGLSTTGTSMTSLFVSYGLVGILAVFTLIANVFVALRKILQSSSIKPAGKFFIYCLIVSLVNALATFTFTNVTAFTFFIIMIISAIIYNFYFNLKKTEEMTAAMKTTDDKINQFGKLANSAILKRIMPSEIWVEIFQAVRIIIALSLLVFTPQVIRFIADLF